jgi:hypothetical protein
MSGFCHYNDFSVQVRLDKHLLRFMEKDFHLSPKVQSDNSKVF